jgi:hypothetical protein
MSRAGQTLGAHETGKQPVADLWMREPPPSRRQPGAEMPRTGRTACPRLAPDPAPLSLARSAVFCLPRPIDPSDGPGPSPANRQGTPYSVRADPVARPLAALTLVNLVL